MFRGRRDLDELCLMLVSLLILRHNTLCLYLFNVERGKQYMRYVSHSLKELIEEQYHRLRSRKQYGSSSRSII